MTKNIAVLAGDGIGPEVMKEALRVLDAVSKREGVKFNYKEGLIGGAAWDEFKTHSPKQTLDLCRNSDAILFGSVGGPNNERHLEKWNKCEANSILALRKEFNFNANFRPSRVYKSLIESSPLKREVLEKGVDLLIVRELLGGIYFGEHKTVKEENTKKSIDICEYSAEQIESVTRISFEASLKRSKKLTLVDKANVLDSSKLWREVVREISEEYKEVRYDEMYVDNCAMQLVTNPSSFDVILTENMFGDILSDLAAVLPGSLGILCSLSVNKDGFSLYEPPGGSAPDIAGEGISNPIGQIRSASMMLKYSFNMDRAYSDIENAIEKVLNAGYRTKDIYSEGDILLGTTEITDKIIEAL